MITDIVMLVDKSGSMGPIWGDVKGGLQYFIDSQKNQENMARLTLVFFDGTNRQNVKILGENIDSICLDMSDVYPLGSTPLYDAIGMAIKETEARLDTYGEHEKADKVIFVIYTDGNENCSKHYSKNDVKEMVENMKELNWDFLFLGASLDRMTGDSVTLQGSGIGMRSIRVCNDASSYTNTMTSLGEVTTEARTRTSGGIRFSAEQYRGMAPDADEAEVSRVVTSE